MSNYKFILIFAGIVFCAATLASIEKEIIESRRIALLIKDEVVFKPDESSTAKAKVDKAVDNIDKAA